MNDSGIEKLKAYQINKMGSDARPIIYSSLIREAKITNLCYAVKSRVKSVNDLLEKKRDKREKKGKKNYQLTDITDVVGFRFVTLFRQQMCDVLEELLSLLTKKVEEKEREKENDVFGTAPLSNAVIQEVIIYKGNSFSDPVFDEINGVIGSFPEAKRVQQEANRDEGYSSIHVVALLNKTGDVEGESNFKLPIEIQIRTVFEDAWGEVDHKYGYKGKSNIKNGNMVNRTPAVVEHLKNLKVFADASANYANIIHKEVTGSYSFNMKKGKVGLPDNWLNEQVTVLKNMAYPAQSISAFKRAQEQIPEHDSEMNLEKCKKAIQLFESLLEANGEPNELFCFCTMNLAYCYMFSGEVEDIIVARDIYISLKDKFRYSPMLLFRLAQSYDQLGDQSAADEIFREAYELLETDLKEGKKLPSYVLPCEPVYLHSALPIFIGFGLWKTSQGKDEDEKACILKDAITITKKVFDRAPSEYHSTQAHNNILYFLWELWTIDKQHPYIAQGEEHLKYVEGHINLADSRDLSWLDTMCKSYEMYQRQDDAVKVANRIIQLIHDGCRTDNPEETLEILVEANRCSN